MNVASALLLWKSTYRAYSRSRPSLLTDSSANRAQHIASLSRSFLPLGFLFIRLANRVNNPV